MEMRGFIEIGMRTTIPNFIYFKTPLFAMVFGFGGVLRTNSAPIFISAPFLGLHRIIRQGSSAGDYSTAELFRPFLTVFSPADTLAAFFVFSVFAY